MIWLWVVLGIFLLLVSAACVLVLSELWRVSFLNGVPSISSTWAIVDRVIAEHALPTNGLILDLGCGRGWTLRRFWRAGIRGPLIGYERSFVPWAIGSVWHWITMTPIRLVHADYRTAPIEEAKGIYLFLLPTLLALLGPELARRAQPGAVIVSAEFSIPGWTPVRVFEARGVTNRKAKVFVYRAA